MTESRHGLVFKRRVEEHRGKIIEGLVVGVSDYPTYRQIIGQLQGLADALKLSDDADYEISGGGE